VSTFQPAIAAKPDALAAITATPWGRWLVPSLSDLFFAALFIWLFIIVPGGWNSLLVDGDTGWHIRTGEYILDHASVPRVDLFSFTKPGAPWFAWEWLSDVLFAVAHRAAGLRGVVLIAGIVIALWPLLLLRQSLWRGANVWAALLLTLLGVGAGSVHFLARPHIFTLLFTTLSIWIIESDRRAPSRRVWWLLPIAVLWANLHGGFVVLLLLLALTALGQLAERRDALRYALLTAACGIVTLVNPYGIELHRHILEYLRSDWIRNSVQEFRAPTFRSEGQLQYEVLLLIGMMIAAWLLARRRFVEALWLIAFAHLSLSSARHGPVFAAIAAPVIAEVLTTFWSSLVCRAPRRGSLRILDQIGSDLQPGFRRTSLWVGGLAVLAVLGCSAAHWPADFPASYFPLGLVRSNAPRLAKGRVLTVDQWGDYLIYRFYPEQRVFADGRSDFLGAELGDEYLRTVQGDYRWRATLKKYRVDTVLAPISWPLATILKSDPAWQIEADDGKAILFTLAGGPTGVHGVQNPGAWSR
jgi:hypothetical protein